MVSVSIVTNLLEIQGYKKSSKIIVTMKIDTMKANGSIFLKYVFRAGVQH